MTAAPAPCALKLALARREIRAADEAKETEESAKGGKPHVRPIA
jgi:hypothetical protein